MTNEEITSLIEQKVEERVQEIGKYLVQNFQIVKRTREMIAEMSKDFQPETALELFEYFDIERRKVNRDIENLYQNIKELQEYNEREHIQYWNEREKEY